MCRKVSGAPFTGFVEFPKGSVDWLDGRPGVFHSSPGVSRRFCPNCGSFLTFEADGVTFLTLGSLDSPKNVRFDCHTYTDFRLPGITLTDDLPQYPGPAGNKGGRLIA